MTMSNPNHPAWSFARMAVGVTALTILICVRAVKLDGTEGVLIIGALAFLVAPQLVHELLKARARGRQ